MRKVVTLLSLFTLASSCSCDDPFLDNTPSPEIEVRDEGGTVAGDPPLIIEFGDVEIGERSARRIIIKNLGTAPLALQRVGPKVDPTDPICPISSAEFRYPLIGAAQKEEIGKDGGEKTIEVGYRPTDGGPDCAIMEIASDDENEGSVRVYLKARGSAAKFCTDAASLDFGDVVIGQRKELATRVGNCGIRPMTLTGVMATSSFPPFEQQSTISTPRTLQPDEMIEVQFAFAPTQARRYGGLGATDDPGVVLFQTDSQGTGSITLTGRGVEPPRCRLTVTPTAINFAQVAVGSTASRPILIQNAGDAPCTVQSITRTDGSADYTVASTSTPFTVGPAQTTTFDIVFAPTGTGLQRATFDVVSDSPTGGTQQVFVEGNQPPPEGCFLQADPSFLNFGVVPTGSITTRQITLTNIGSEDCSLRKIEFPIGAAEFTSTAFIIPVFGTMIPQGETYVANIDFRTNVPGPKTGRAHFIYKEGGFGGTDMTLDVDLAANAQAPAICLTPDPVDFGSVPVGGEARRNLTMQSCGAADLNVRGLHFASGSSTAFTIPAAPGLPIFLPAGASINVEIVYRPGQTQGDLGVLVVNSDDPQIPTANVRVLGNAEGLCPPLMKCTPETLDYGVVEQGVPETRTVVCRNYGTQSVTITSATVASSPPFTSTATLPATLGAGEGMTVQVTLNGQAPGAVSGTLTVQSNACESTQQVQLTATVIGAIIPDCLPPSSFQPREEWTWTSGTIHPRKNQVWIAPVVINLTDDNADGVISAQDIPDVIFSTFDRADFSTNPMDPNIGAPIPAVVRAVSGDDGRELWTVQPEALQVQSEAGLAAGDIDGDNKPEIIGSKFVLLEGESPIGGEGPKLLGRYLRGRLLCFDNEGRFRWESDEWTAAKEEGEDGGAPVIADLDQDGFAEVIYRAHVYDHEGHLKWVGSAGSGSTGHGSLPVAVDLDGDGRLELLAGFSAYRADGSVLWHRTDLGFDGNAAVADLDGDGKPEVVVHNGKLHILNGENGTNHASIIDLPYPDPNCQPGSEDTACETPIPTNVALADFDADGLPEISASNRDFLLVYEADGTENWRATINDQSGASGPSAFDFEGDGIYEVVYSDEVNTFAYRGTDGGIL